MERLTALILTLLALVIPASAKPPTDIAVLEFKSKGGISQEQMEALGDMLATEIRSLGEFHVIGTTDIRAAFRLEEQKKLAGCDDDSCIGEIGGALGVRWVLLGNVGLFGETYLLNMKIMNVESMRVAASVAQKFRGSQDAMLDALPELTRKLFTDAGLVKQPTTIIAASSSAHSLWGHVSMWSGTGCLALSGLAFYLAQSAGDNYDQNGDPTDRDSSRTWSGVMWTGLGLGTALITTGLILWAQDPSPPNQTQPSISLLPDGSGLTFSLQGRW